MEPTEGIVLGGQGNVVLVQTFDAIGQSCADATVVPDRAGLLATSAKRLRDMLAQPDAYRLGSADRLAPLLEVTTGTERTFRVSHRLVDPHDHLDGRALDATAAIGRAGDRTDSRE